MNPAASPQTAKPEPENLIWFLGLGYFIFYTPYAGLTKATTRGMFEGLEAVPGTFILPVSAIATLVAMFLFVTLKKWWSYTEQRSLMGLNIPVPRKKTLVSGLATAAIIGATTMAFSFDGVSILFSLILMRGGVLIIARLSDAVARRKVAWYATAGMVLTLIALVVIFAEEGGYAMTLAAAINLALYLGGYTVRFQVIHSLTKTEDRQLKLRYFVEEQMVALPALVIILALSAFLFSNPVSLSLREGFTAIWVSPALLPALLIGVGYASLYVFGTMIYLDAREYTFCVPINRASSILAGIAATLVLYLAAGYDLPSGYQLAGAGLLIAAILVLGLPTWRMPSQQEVPLQRMFLFVCGGNRLRSPMAQAICGSHLANLLEITPEQLSAHGIRIESAGLSATPGADMKPHGREALASLDLVAHKHEARPLTTDLIADAEGIFCMTADQRAEILAMAGKASPRIHCLDEQADLEEPANREEAVAFGRRLHDLINAHFAEFKLDPDRIQL